MFDQLYQRLGSFWSGIFVWLGVFLLLLAGWLLAGCGMPITKAGFQQQASHALGPFHGRLDALDRKVMAFEEITTDNFAVVNENFQTIDDRLGRVETEVGQVSGKANLIVKKLDPIGRDANVASREATAGRKAAEVASQKIVEAQKAIGEKIDTTAATTGMAIADVGQKVDEEARTTRDHAERTAQRIRDDMVVNVHDLREDHKKIVGSIGDVDKKVIDHADELDKARQDILRLLSSIPPPPAPGHP